MAKQQKSRTEALGDRMKMFEAREGERRFMPGLPVIARLDGRSFHTFTRGMTRPFDLAMSRAMIETARYLVEETHACFAYTQSDEITLGFWNPEPDAQMLFDGRILKIVSVLAGLATAKFNEQTRIHMPERLHLLPVFDCRAKDLPNLDEMVNAVLFRVLDCAKNSITMAAAAYYSHKELQGKSSSDKHEMLHAKGVNWADYPEFFKNGTFLRRETFLRGLTREELARIPERHRPSGPVMRSAVVELTMPRFARLANPKDVLFYGAAPELATAVPTTT